MAICHPEDKSMNIYHCQLIKYVQITIAELVVCVSVACSAQNIPVFDGDRAFGYLVKQCEFGPRDPGSAGHKQCRDYLISTLRLFADQVEIQSFLLTFGNPAKSVNATNITAHFSPEKGKRILLCAHWDTRPWADMDANPSNHNKPILGANDGASGVAVLLEIARILKQQKPAVGVDIVLFDGEDIGTRSEERSYARGSAEFASRLDRSYQPIYGLLLDLVGDADLHVKKEAYSVQFAGHIVEKVWSAARSLGITAFEPQIGYAVFDDHMPLIERGIPCIDIIDFDYPYWHTTQDTPDKCSAASLETIGTVVVHLVYSE